MEGDGLDQNATPPVDLNTTLETIAQPENEFVSVMNSLEALNEAGRRRVVDVIPENKEKSLPKAVVIPARIPLDSQGHKGTVFVTSSGVFIDSAGDNGLLDQRQQATEEYEEAYRGIRHQVERQYPFTTWDETISFEVRDNEILKGNDNGELMIRHLEDHYRKPELFKNRATPDQLRMAKSAALARAPRPSSTVSPGAYTEALK